MAYEAAYFSCSICLLSSMICLSVGIMMKGEDGCEMFPNREKRDDCLSFDREMAECM